MPRLREPGRFSHWVYQNRALWFAVLFIASVGIDQGSKITVQSTLADLREVPVHHNVDGELKKEIAQKHVSTGPVRVIPGLLNFVYVENPAAAFSLTRSVPEWFRRPFLVIFSALAMLGMAIWYFFIRLPDGLVQTAIALICGGAMGNLIDRARLGYVIDFVDVYAAFTTPPWHYPTWNIADACIVVGALIIIFRTFMPLSHPEEQESEVEIG